MYSMTDICFLCIKINSNTVVDDSIASQVAYLIPEITIIKLGIPLRICSICEENLQSFNTFKKSCLENTLRLEATINEAQCSKNTSDSKDGISTQETSLQNFEEIYIKKEIIDENPTDYEEYDELMQIIVKEGSEYDNSCSNDNQSDGYNESPADQDLLKVKNANSKEYNCSVCRKSFQWKSFLARHMLIHKGANENCSVEIPMDNTPENININELIINEVQKYPFLYVVGHKNYRDVALKNKVWRDIGEKVGLEGDIVFKKWTNLRDRYMKEKRQTSKTENRFGGPPAKKKKWIYYDYLSFLDSPRIPTQKSNIPGKSTVQDEESAESDSGNLDVKNTELSMVNTGREFIPQVIMPPLTKGTLSILSVPAAQETSLITSSQKDPLAPINTCERLSTPVFCTSSTSTLEMNKSRILLSQRDKEKYAWNGYLYVKDKINKEGSIQFWRCEKKNKGCKSRIWTSVLDGSLISEKQEHTCSHFRKATRVMTPEVRTAKRIRIRRMSKLT